MSSGAIPATEQFVVGACNNFHVVVKAFMNTVIQFGDPGREIISSVSLPLVEPLRDDSVAGRRVYPLDVHPPVGGAPSILGPEFGERFFQGDLQFYRSKLLRRDEYAQGLMSHLFKYLSPGSLDALEIYPQFAAYKASMDTFAIWELNLKTHQYGNSRTKQRFMIDLASVKQLGSHEAYVGDVRAKARLVGCWCL